MLIKRILIITNEGIPVFDYKEYAKEDEALVGGLITALMKFAEETTKESISRVMLQESQFILKKYNSVLFVVQVLEDMPRDYAEEILNLIATNFFKDHKEDIENFRGNVSTFSSFQEKCKNILQYTGIELANKLLNKKDDPLAWGIFSKEGKALFVRADSPNYNVDNFTIMQVLGKSIDKIIKSQFQLSTSIAYHINFNGNVFSSIILPFVHIIAERKLNAFAFESIKKFKIMTKAEIKQKFVDSFNIEEVEISVFSKTASADLEKFDNKSKSLLDLFQASTKGFEYLFNSESLIQLLNFHNSASIVLNLVNRYIVANIQTKQSSEDVLKKIINFLM
ncbi:MAG: hypothetical protein K9W46_14145 [Candidatus Heimdallarchaeum endolithica]|uniref:FUZ/MON1/HPS1 first Longin domain-containing protein n=1 Tax=Candidatus Heimdallarchaeum endolithica TaxID=2876572 RepID=A0A9Y1FNT8_9ARCH|nr:MAG: hypothetical protein K9W46_14145 [Candidatus Heimdallarchaeum endolithica]